jgi:hypothetical protein
MAMGAGARDAPDVPELLPHSSHASTPPSALGTHPWLPQKDTEHGTNPLAFPRPTSPLRLGDAGHCHCYAPGQLRRAHGLGGARGLPRRPGGRLWLEPECGRRGLIAAMDLLWPLRTTGGLAGRPVRPPPHDGGGRPAVSRDLGAHWPRDRPLAVHPHFWHWHECGPGDFPSPPGLGGHRVVPEAPGRGHGAVTVGAGPRQRAVCALDGGAPDPDGLALGVLGPGDRGGTAPVGAHPLLPQRAGRARAAPPGRRSASAPPARAARAARAGADDPLPPAGPAHLRLLEPHLYPLLGVFRPCHPRRVPGRVARAQGLSLARARWW